MVCGCLCKKISSCIYLCLYIYPHKYFCLCRFMSLGHTFMSICHAAGKYLSLSRYRASRGCVSCTPFLLRSTAALQCERDQLRAEKASQSCICCRCARLQNIMSPELLPASAEGLGVRACIAEQSLRRHGSARPVMQRLFLSHI